MRAEKDAAQRKTKEYRLSRMRGAVSAYQSRACDNFAAMMGSRLGNVKSRRRPPPGQTDRSRYRAGERIAVAMAVMAARRWSMTGSNRYTDVDSVPA